MKLTKVHEDSRGVTYSLEGDLEAIMNYPEVAIFKTRAGKARGGCIHHINREFVCVLEGEIGYVFGEDKTRKLMSAGDSFCIPKSTPHYFYSITDSIVMEWGATLAEKKVKHPAFRQVVDKINEGEL